MINEKQRKRAFNAIILTQCLGMVAAVLFQNGFYLNYFAKLGLESSTIALLFALPPLVGAFVMIPFAYHSDRMGKKRLALAGQVLLIASLVAMMAAGWVGVRFAFACIAVSLLLYCVGGSLQGANWFALLIPIIPKEIRGRFFGRLRVSFMTVCFLFTLLVTRVLKSNQSMAAFQMLLGLVLVAALVRYFTYARIPELDDPRGDPNRGHSFRQALKSVFAVPGFLSFNGYVFLVVLFTGGVPIVFALMQKDVFGFSPAQITLMGTLLLAGSIAGNWVGGRISDRHGNQATLLVAHTAYAVVIIAMVARHWMPWSLLWHVGGCSFLFSLVGALAGVAITAEALILIPAANKSLSTAFHMTLVNFGTALSSLFVSHAIGLHLLAPEWAFRGYRFSDYDTLLLAFAGLVLLMLATIGLVLWTKGKARRPVPGGTMPSM